MRSRLLTAGEIELARSIYHDSIDFSEVEIRSQKWFPFQPRTVVMAPCGHIHFHPLSDHWSSDYSKESISLQGLLIHELCHIWQAQTRGKYWLPFMRHPFCRYDYALYPGRAFDRYGIEQQAEIARHAFMLAHGHKLPGAPGIETYRSLLPFKKVSAT